MSEDRINALEDRIAELTEELAETRRDLAAAQLDQWKGRIDELEVQMHLARLETESQFEPVVEQLRNRWLDAREQLGGATSKAADTIGALRSGIEQAWDDLREAARNARPGSDG